MTNKDLKGLVILLKSDKTLVQTQRIRVYQRENLVDKFQFLIPFEIDGNDLTKFTVMMQYLGPDGTVYGEVLERSPEDYEDADGNVTHMIYTLPITSAITKQAGDITVKLNLDYMDYEGQTSDPEEDPEPKHYVLNSDTTIVPILAVADYYSFVPDASLSMINNKIAELNTKTQELEALAHQFTDEQVDNIVLNADPETGEIHLSSKGQKIGDGIGLKDLNDALNEYDDSVIVDPDDPVNPDPVDPNPVDPNPTDPTDPTDPTNP